MTITDQIISLTPFDSQGARARLEEVVPAETAMPTSRIQTSSRFVVGRRPARLLNEAPRPPLVLEHVVGCLESIDVDKGRGSRLCRLDQYLH